MTKLHPSIIITRNMITAQSTLSMVDSKGEVTDYHHSYNWDVVDSLAVNVSDQLWTIEVSERPAKPRPQRIWDESL